MDATLNDTMLSDAARAAGLEPALVAAVAEVESGGRYLARIKGRYEPLIRFEGHYFDRRLTGAALLKARSDKLAHPVAGRIANPASQAARWALFDRAAAINRPAAIESTSWGCGQVMGAHWKRLGYASPDDLMARARSGPDGQIELMLRFIAANGLDVFLRKRDWAGFARAYNGPGFRANRYDEKLASAYARHSSRTGNLPTAMPADLDIAALQRKLAALGYSVAIDGIAGPQTRQALRRFQASAGLDEDSIYSGTTRLALDAAIARMQDEQAAASHVRRFFRWLFRWLIPVA